MVSRFGGTLSSVECDIYLFLVMQLRDDLMTMLIAGHETTAAVLTWAVFLLAQVCFRTTQHSFLV